MTTAILVLAALVLAALGVDLTRRQHITKRPPPRRITDELDKIESDAAIEEADPNLFRRLLDKYGRR